MASRFTFGGYGGDQVTQDPAGNSGIFKAASNYNSVGTFWSAQFGGTQYTDLVDPNNGFVAITGISTDAHGDIVPFQGPAGIGEGWIDFGRGRFKVIANEGVSAIAALGFTPNWQPNTAYLAGQAVVNPSGDLVTAKVNFTSGASYSATNWNLSASYAPATGSTVYAPQQVSGKGIPRVVNRADYASYSAAATAAGSGGTIFYPDGVWTDAPLTISTPLTIDGRRATIQKSANGAAVSITAQGVIITKGVTIDANGPTYTGPGVQITGNGTTQDTSLDCPIINADQWCVDVGIGAAQRGKFHMLTATTRQRTVADAAITAGSTTLTSATANFVSTDVGKFVWVLGAQNSVGSNYFMSIITAVTNSTTVTLLDAANVTVSAASCDISAPAFRFGAEQAAGVTGDRSIQNVTTGGVGLADFGGAQTVNVQNTNSRGYVFSSSSCVKVCISGSNRFATTGAASTIRGTQHTVTGAAYAGDVIFDATATDCAEGGNVTAGNIIDKGVRTRLGNFGGGAQPFTVDPRMLSGASALNANQAVYLRAQNSGYVTKIGLHVGTSSGNLCVGVYANNGSGGTSARPAAQKATSGSVACPAAGYAEVALPSPVFIQAGDWFAIAADNATATFYRAGAAGFGSAMANGLSAYQSSAFPLPATASPSTGSAYSVILTGVV